jgi:hypothetical protein
MLTSTLSKLGIRPEEERLALLLFVESFLLGVGFNFLETSAFPLFLVEFSPQILPTIYILNALVVVAVTWGYLRLGRRVSFGRQLVLTLAFLMGLVAAAWLALRLGAGRWAVFTLPILFQVVVTLGNLGFWSMTNRLLTLRQSKRLIGPIGAGMWVAIVLTGFLIPRVVSWVGTVNLLGLSALGLLAALAMLMGIVREFGAGLIDTAAGDGGRAPAQRSARALLASPYVALMFALTIVSWLAFYFVDNIFYNRVGAQFPTEAELSGFLGLYLAFLGLFTLFNNFVLTGFIINRFGVRAGLLILPVSLLLVTGAISVIGTAWGIVPLLFWLATLNKVLDLGLAFSVDQSAQTILYQALPAAERTRIQTIDTGIVRMVAVGGAGVLLLLLNQVWSFDVVQLSYVLLVIVGLWLVGVFLTGRAYPKALVEALAQRRLTGLALTLDDPLTADVVRATLDNPQPGPALFALNLLLEQDAAGGLTYLRRALDHPAREVRLAALARAADPTWANALAAEVTALATGDPDPAVRAAALRAVAAAPGAAGLLADSLTSPDPAIRQAALAGLLRCGDCPEREAAFGALRALAQSPDPEDRATAAHLLRTTGAADKAAILRHLLADPVVMVRRAAIAAAAQDGSGLWPEIVAALNDPATRQSAALALTRANGVDDERWAAVTAAWSDPATPPAALVSLARVIAAGDGGTAAATLRQRLDDLDDTVRLAVLQGLRDLGYQATTEGERAAIDRQLDRELAHAAWLLALSHDCAVAPELSYLSRLAARRADLARSRVLLLLATRYDPVALERVIHAVRSPSDERRSYALEILDTTLPGELKARVMPLMEELPIGRRLQRLRESMDHPVLEPGARVQTALEPGRAGDAWLRAACVHAVGQLPADTQSRALLTHYAAQADPLLAETAMMALIRLQPAADIPAAQGVIPMLSTIEKVILLKDVDLFSEMPDELLAEVASLLTEVELAAGQMVFAKGDSGDSLYVIVDGEVRVFDGAYTINHLGEGEVFGEMALLDTEPRMASVMAVSDTLMLRLEQEPFFDLMETRSEVARGVIRVLSARLRGRVAEVTELRNRQQLGVG